jgi:hypothetical protein
MDIVGDGVDMESRRVPTEPFDLGPGQIAGEKRELVGQP